MNRIEKNVMCEPYRASFSSFGASCAEDLVEEGTESASSFMTDVKPTSRDEEILEIVRRRLRKGEEYAFAVVDLEAVSQRYNMFVNSLPTVTPFYAIKCNPDRRILSLLSRLGSGFDSASLSEIDMALDAGADPSRIIFANPIKQANQIEGALRRGVDFSTFDGVEELDKIAAHSPGANVLLRLLPDDSSARCRLGMKYGAPVSTIPTLLKCAAKLDLNVVGVSFHVGSGNANPTAWESALALARKAFDINASMGLPQFSHLNIGGGFPSDPSLFLPITSVVRRALRESFTPDITVMAEPGRFFVEDSQSLAITVIGKRSFEDSETMYYVNDSLYSSFNCLLYDHAVLKTPLSLTRQGDVKDTRLEASSVWGQTCDGLDCVMREVQLPVLAVGDWLLFKHMGAYTTAAGSDFNGFEKPGVVYIEEE